jgi:hypothetical protein
VEQNVKILKSLDMLREVFDMDAKNDIRMSEIFI